MLFLGNRTAVFVFGVFALLAIPAHAQEKLTEEKVTEFIEQTMAITAGREEEMTADEIKKYLNTHIHTQARFKSTMRYVIPGFDVQEKTMSVDKADFIEGVELGAQSMSDYESKIKIEGIDISPDGTKAVVQTQTMETGRMPVSDEIELEEVPVIGMSSCTQTLMMTRESVIQMFNATCFTEIQFQTFEP